MPGRALHAAACAALLAACGRARSPEAQPAPAPGAFACDGLVPAAGAGVSASGPGSYSERCFGTTDGNGGFVALGHGQARSYTYDVVPIGGGAPVGAFGASAPVVPTERGFQVSAGASATRFLAVDALGVPTAVEDLGYVTVHANPRGGSVLYVVRPVDGAGAERREVQWRTARGGVIASVAVEGLYGLVGVARSGDALVTIRGAGSSATALRWIGPAGPLSAPFAAPLDPVWPPSGTLLADGSLALTSGGADWIGVVTERGKTVAPAPAWLQGRRPSSIAVVRGGAANALLPDDAALHASPGERARIEIVAASGEPCGALELPSGLAVRDVSVGRDGTVIVAGVPLPHDPAHPEACTWRWWPGLLR